MSSDSEGYNEFDQSETDELISPIEFEPNFNRVRSPFYRFSWTHIPIAAFVLISGLAGWFVITAKSILIEPVPITSQVSLRSGFGVKLGSRYLMRTGSYAIEISNPGYKNYRSDITVGNSPSQAFKFELAKLPGSLGALGGQLHLERRGGRQVRRRRAGVGPSFLSTKCIVSIKASKTHFCRTLRTARFVLSARPPRTPRLR